MKKLKGQILLGLVCIVLGLMISIQFNATKNSQDYITSRQFKDVAKEIEQLKKERDDISLKLQEYQKKVDSYEKSASDENATTKNIKDELDKVRVLAGLTDVEGPGVIVNITPANDMLSKQPPQIYNKDLMDIVNELNSSGAEAISINDERFVGRTQIREAGSIIKINDSKFDPSQPFEVKAIGNPAVLEGAFKMPGGPVEYLKSEGFDVKISEKQNVKILKYNKYIDYKYVKRIGE